ncbi:hypothetical protein EVAR_10567_1 [Eumeta japonica]|uniref:Uncharacterized protein n=1 Tax=Eumeta variegata TaxID=151549 RepID=A0A4C1U397_EUMVA|nr:hypothetical protein EVAR_10567_1 [Eumeta japonica]
MRVLRARARIPRFKLLLDGARGNERLTSATLAELNFRSENTFTDLNARLGDERKSMKHQKKLLAILVVTAAVYKMPTLQGLRGNQTPLANTLGLPGEALGAGAAHAQTFTEWLNAHEDAQVVAASLLMIVGAWWLLRGILSVVINLALPLLIVVFAMISVPQLRVPILGDSYPAVAVFLRTILLKLAELLKTP